jgi:DNA-binding transcriptional ArsR family regulator
VLLHGEIRVSDLAERVQSSQSAVSHQLRVLRDLALSPAGVKVSKFSTVLMTNTLRTCSKKLLRTAATSQNEGRPPDEKLYHSPARPGLR